MKSPPPSSSASAFSHSRGPESAGPAPVPASLAPLIERMFRYTWFVATEKRDAMVREGRKEEVDALVAEARAFHALLRGDAAGFFGILYAGCVLVPIYPPARPWQLADHLRRQAEILANAGAELLVTVPEARVLATFPRS
ncbi:MAG: hypothetical protein OXF79_16070 [Chloroflexi bacterium]|nr:hypothetical protein [Chloroflexota bacterium]